jgi:hypothetical protein
MIFPSASYPDAKLTWLKIMQSDCSRVHVIDLRHPVNDAFIAYCLRLTIKGCVLIEKAKIDYLMQRLDGIAKNPDKCKKYPNCEHLIQEKITECQNNERTFQKLYGQLLRDDYCGIDFILESKKTSLQGNSICRPNRQTIFEELAFYFGDMMILKLEECCPFLHTAVHKQITAEEMIIIICDLPESLKNGLIANISGNPERIHIVCLREKTMQQLFADLCTKDQSLMHGAHLHLHQFVDIPNAEKAKVFLVNPVFRDEQAFKMRERANNFLVLSDDQSTRFFQSQNRIYREVSAERALS